MASTARWCVPASGRQEGFFPCGRRVGFAVRARTGVLAVLKRGPASCVSTHASVRYCLVLIDAFFFLSGHWGAAAREA